MRKTLISAACCAAFAAAGLPAYAQQTGTFRIDYLGPGGHSQNNYGRTSALHAAGRTALMIQQSLPVGSYAITDLTGGNSVNSIASDGLIVITIAAANAATYQAMVTTITNAAASGATAENDFRGVKVGDLTGGAPAWIRATVTQQGTAAAAAAARRSTAARQKNVEQLH